jgi:hypothetical protein
VQNSIGDKTPVNILALSWEVPGNVDNIVKALFSTKILHVLMLLLHYPHN